MSKIIDFFVNFFGPVYNAIKRTLNLEELLKAFTTALAAGGGFFAILASLQNQLASIITDPTVLPVVQKLVALLLEKNWIGVALFVAVLVGDLVRRYYHGVDIKPILPVIKAQGLLPPEAE